MQTQDARGIVRRQQQGGAILRPLLYCSPLISHLSSLSLPVLCMRKLLGRSAHHPRCLVEARYDGQAPGVPYRTRDSVMDWG